MHVCIEATHKSVQVPARTCLKCVHRSPASVAGVEAAAPTYTGGEQASVPMGVRTVEGLHVHVCLPAARHALLGNPTGTCLQA